MYKKNCFQKCNLKFTSYTFTLISLKAGNPFAKKEYVQVHYVVTKNATFGTLLRIYGSSLSDLLDRMLKMTCSPYSLVLLLLTVCSPTSPAHMALKLKKQCYISKDVGRQNKSIFSFIPQQASFGLNIVFSKNCIFLRILAPLNIHQAETCYYYIFFL